MPFGKAGDFMKRYVIAVDQSTSASKAFLIDADGQIVNQALMSHKQYYPSPGRVEHDAEEIWRNVQTVIDRVCDGVAEREIAAISISNQRETTVVWDADTGAPVCPAIVWQDVRGETVCRELSQHAPIVHQKTGLTLSPYFPAAKLRALFQENDRILRRAQAGEVRFGTIDSYLIFRMTGGYHATDTTNASRTQLMNLEKLKWDPELLDLFGIPADMLPQQILSADSIFGSYRGIPITGVLGDSHAALYGQGCHVKGMAKATYGTGSSVMLNVGERPIIAPEGLSASVAFSVGGRTLYALEGNVTCSGDTLIWLCDTLGLFENPGQVEGFAATVKDAQGVYLIPAFAGLGAPYFDSAARAALCGMNRDTQKAHVAYAALASIAHQDADVLEIMQMESGYNIRQLFADGGPSRNTQLMQMQADYAGCQIQCASVSELSALGAAYIGGVQTGMFRDFDSIPARMHRGKTYQPTLTEAERVNLRQGWKTAVRRCLTN